MLTCPCLDSYFKGIKAVIMSSLLPVSKPPGSIRHAYHHSRSNRVLRYRIADNGYWVAFLLPMAFYISDLDLERETLTAVLVITGNVILLTLLHWLELNLTEVLQRLKKMTVGISCVVLVVVCLSGGDMYESASFLLINFSFSYLFCNLIKQHPRSFTFGEGVLVISAFSYRFWGASQSLPFPLPENPMQSTETALVSMSLQLLFFGAILGARLVLLMQKPWKLFGLEEMFCLWGKYCVIAFFTKIPIQKEIDQVPMFLLNWPLNFLCANKLRVQIIFGWALVCFLAVLMYWVLKRFSFSQRSHLHHKVFHFAIVLIFLSGIACDLALIYFCSSIIFYCMILVETIRILELELGSFRIGETIDGRVRTLRNHLHDQGNLLLTPTYVLAGCSLPIWLTDLEDANDLNPVQYSACIAGILSVGIGDTFAGIGNIYFGRRRWRDTRKYVEGTMFSIVAQFIVAAIIYIFDIIPYDAILVIGQLVAIVINAIIGGNTNQSDYLVLPLVTFIVIHGFNHIFYNVIES